MEEKKAYFGLRDDTGNERKLQAGDLIVWYPSRDGQSPYLQLFSTDDYHRAIRWTFNDNKELVPCLSSRIAFEDFCMVIGQMLGFIIERAESKIAEVFLPGVAMQLKGE